MTGSRWLVRGLLLFVLAFANLNDIRAGELTPGGEAPGLWSPDVLPNALFAWTVIKEHDIDYDEFTAPAGATTRKPDREANSFRACGPSRAKRSGNTRGCTLRLRRRSGSSFGKRPSRCLGISPPASCWGLARSCARPPLWQRLASTGSDRADSSR